MSASKKKTKAVEEEGAPENLDTPQDSDSADGEAPPESDDYYAKFLRLTADFENFKRRRAQEFIDQRRYSSEGAALALLPVLDTLERALEHAPDTDDAKAFVEGVRMATRNFVATLEDLGVTPVEAVGKPFDPAVHEAIGSEESAEVEADTVTTELQRGWRLHDRLLRPAVVRIATPAKED